MTALKCATLNRSCHSLCSISRANSGKSILGASGLTSSSLRGELLSASQGKHSSIEQNRNCCWRGGEPEPKRTLSRGLREEWPPRNSPFSSSRLHDGHTGHTELCSLSPDQVMLKPQQAYLSVPEAQGVNTEGLVWKTIGGFRQILSPTS